MTRATIATEIGDIEIDLFDEMHKIFGAETLSAVRQKVKFLVYEGWTLNPTAAAADAVLPSAVYAEKEGTFTNFEGRAQRFKKAVEPLGASKPTLEILEELGKLL